MALAGLLAGVGYVRADDGADAARERARAQADAPLPEGAERRPLPEYGSAPVSTRSSWLEGVLWLPRVALAPAYFTGELVAQPLMALGAFAEKHRVRERIHDFFTFGPDQSMALYPVAWLDWGMDPSAGVRYSWHRPGPADDVSASIMTSGADSWRAHARWSTPLGARRLALRGYFSQRDDLAFYGLGGDSAARELRYGERTGGARVALAIPLRAPLTFTSWVGGSSSSFDASPGSSGSTLGQAIATGEMQPPPALAGGLSALEAGLRLELDNRRGRVVRAPRAAADLEHVSGSGVALRAELSQHQGLRATRAGQSDEPELPAWWRAAASLTGTLDLTGTQRRVELELYAASVDPLRGASAVPFTEQVSLGGARPLRGFGSRRLAGRSAAVATLRYRWPIWSELDGTLHYALGNVFGPHWRGLGPQGSRSSFGLGVATASSSDHVFELLLAFGSEPLSRGGQIEHTRVAAGWNAAF